uniref:Uncharacterized protein n=1 Tax=Arundo donax TaxID=35708 RepID=A0A0A9GSA8_ARUDO
MSIDEEKRYLGLIHKLGGIVAMMLINDFYHNRQRKFLYFNCH